MESKSHTNNWGCKTFERRFQTHQRCFKMVIKGFGRGRFWRANGIWRAEYRTQWWIYPSPWDIGFQFTFDGLVCAPFLVISQYEIYCYCSAWMVIELNITRKVWKDCCGWVSGLFKAACSCCEGVDNSWTHGCPFCRFILMPERE